MLDLLSINYSPDQERDENGRFADEGGFTKRDDGKYDLEGHTIARETEKAYLIKAKDGSEAWVPKSQVTKDGEKLTMPDWIANKFDPPTYSFEPEFHVGETEKAFDMRISVGRPDGEPESARVFLPKSQVSYDKAGGKMSIPKWLKAAKEADFLGGETGRGKLLW